LQRLRNARTEQEPKKQEEETAPPKKAASEESKKKAPDKKAKKEKEEDPGCVDLLRPDLAFLFDSCAPSSGYLVAAKKLVNRMAWGVGSNVNHTTGAHFVASELHGADFLKAASSSASAGALARAQLFALRRIAEGSGIVVADLIALHLFLTDSGFHSGVCQSWATLAEHQAPEAETARALELQGAHGQLSHALKAIPSKKSLCYRACRIQTASGTCREILQGHRHGLDKYSMGSMVMWRHAASATTDSNLAEEVALRGDPGCGIIFKIRRSLGARPVAEFSEYPEQGEMLFAPGSVFRVVGLFPCSEHVLNRGGSGSDSPWSIDVGYVAQHSENMSFDDACRARSLVVVLDEETSATLAKEGGGA